MQVRFHAETAAVLSSRLRCAAEDLGRQGVERQASVVDVETDFAGIAQQLFARACQTSVDDRRELIASLRTLADQVDRMAEQAAQEQRRRDDLDGWYERETARLRARVPGDPTQAMQDEWARITDPRPSSEPLRPRPIRVSFRAQGRSHSAEGAPASGRSSADPVRLRSFVGVARALDREAHDLWSRLSGVWTDFTASCSWAPIEQMDVLDSFVSFLSENAWDADWVERVAEAFERAGGGLLSDVTIGTCALGRLPSPLRKLLDPALASPDVLAAWTASGLTPADVAGLPLSTQIAFADLDGLPAAARDAASRAVLAAAECDPQWVYLALGLGGGQGIGLTEFTAQMSALREAVRDADDKAKRLPTGPEGKVAQLVGLSVDDGALVAAISLGDLDTADRVTVNVPGALTTVGDMKQNVRVAKDLFDGAAKVDEVGSLAVVSWIGYHAPGNLEVWSDERADSGSPRLGGFIDGVLDARRDVPPESTTVLAHSYASPLTVDACSDLRHRIEAFVSYGSVGVGRDTDVDELNVDKVFATEADFDVWANVGRLGNLGPRVDLRMIDGVRTLSAAEGDGTRAVTGHDMSPDESTGAVGYLSPDSTSFASVVQVIATGDVIR
ncbi:hypothetical protein C5E12_12145 [Rathayibacter rathayi]|uniref:alpha/beta hydrolase n=1 Tax=Rathayibacter rathayi TaxID=33887 RepID=UPI000CE8CE30|nr:alpha/beta hydrolase [Rathayibacter rathayi]PPI68141.1 hypothetical protein C5E12_12145 [Rathayibacter rathayi]